MPRTSWTISCKKSVKSRSKTPPRERRRFPATPTTTPALTKSQSTLTQIAWVPQLSRSISDVTMRTPSGEATPSRPRQDRSLKKQRSTLTQIGFVRRQHDHADFDDTMITEAMPPLSAQIIPQFDGAHTSPRKPRPRKKGVDGLTERPNAAERGDQAEHQEHRPTKRRKRGNDSVEPETANRRTSSRLAKRILSDPTQNHDYFEEALSRPSPRDRIVQTPTSPKRLPVLEVQDSTDVGQELPPTRPRLSQLAPQTPETKRTIVLSSQSPESVRTASTKRKRQRANVDEASARSPLKELDVNNVRQRQVGKGEDHGREAVRNVGSRKRSRLSTLPKSTRKRRIEDSQTDVYSIQPTSSPGQQQSVSQQRTPGHVGVPEASAQAENHPPTLEAVTDRSETSDGDAKSAQSSQSDTGRDTQASLPEVTTLLGLASDPQDFAEPRAEANPSTPTISRVIVRDFAASVSEPSGMPTTEPPIETPKMNENDEGNQAGIGDNDSVSDFGSPVANDTQFHAIVAGKSSSPDRLIDVPSSGRGRRSSDTIELSSASRARRQPSLDHQGVETLTTHNASVLLPEPQLVRTTPGPRLTPTAPDESLELPQLPPPASRSVFRHTSTQVPLNDKSTSSLSSSADHPLGPAVVPNPSQISTQEPTQMRMSSMHGLESEIQRRDQVTIKDSSSTPIALSQLPQYDQSDDDDEDFDFDLDPVSEHQAPVSTPESAKQTEAQAQPPDSTPKASRSKRFQAAAHKQHDVQPPPSSSELDVSSPIPTPLKRKHSPIPGFDNDTQANFTQDGHVTAAYIHRQREKGAIPDWYTPAPYQVKNFKRGSKSRRKRQKRQADDNNEEAQ